MKHIYLFKVNEGYFFVESSDLAEEIITTNKTLQKMDDFFNCYISKKKHYISSREYKILENGVPICNLTEDDFLFVPAEYRLSALQKAKKEWDRSAVFIHFKDIEKRYNENCQLMKNYIDMARSETEFPFDGALVELYVSKKEQGILFDNLPTNYTIVNEVI